MTTFLDQLEDEDVLSVLCSKLPSRGLNKLFNVGVNATHKVVQHITACKTTLFLHLAF